MNNPTDEQVKEFWEWCGWKHRLSTTWGTPERWKFTLANGATESLSELPTIDLNNLFKYAVPKLKETHAIQMRNYVDTNTWEVETIGAMIGYNSSLVKDEDPALALFWAIWEAIKGTK